jgi:Family of unknown function (DUF5754)
MKIVPSSRPDKKYTAIFDDGLRVNFGAVGYTDYTLGATDEQRSLYRKRHKKDLETRNPKRPGFLSYYILWGDSRDIRQNVLNYKKMFGL